jgi:hypothetical protein
VDKSLFRIYQDKVIRQFANSFHTQSVVEWGGVEENNYRSYFSDHIKYRITNINSQNPEDNEDITNLSSPSNSVECALCISVLQHVFEIDKAISEIIRVLKPGGKCLITNGFMFPVCMEHDYYRLTEAYWRRRLENEPVNYELIPLGNIHSSIDNLLMRPYGKYMGVNNKIKKILSVPFKLMRAIVQSPDNAPLGVAVIITKQENDGSY